MLPAYILAGGQSRRFGSDKARHPTHSGPQLLALADQLRTAGHTVSVVADRADRYIDLGITCVVDVQPDSGPLAGLAAALEHHLAASQPGPRSTGWLMLVSCDQQHWQSSWYEELARHTSDAVDAAVYFDTQWQPLPALYHCDLLPPIMQRLALRQLSLHGLLDSLGERVARVSTTAPPSRWSFNTLSDLNHKDERA